MKKTTRFLELLLIVLYCHTSYAQMSGNGNYGGNRIGQQPGGIMDRSQPEPPEEIPPATRVANYIKEMKPAVGLDELQCIAISNVLLESIKTQGRISKMELAQEDLFKEYSLLAASTDRKILDFLQKDQKDKYSAFKEQQKLPKKSKNKKKDKKSESKEK